MDALSRALIKLYDEPVKPTDPVLFVRKNFVSAEDNVKAESEVIESGENEEKIQPEKEKSSDALIQSLREELLKARKEIAALQEALDAMQNST